MEYPFPPEFLKNRESETGGPLPVGHRRSSEKLHPTRVHRIRPRIRRVGAPGSLDGLWTTAPVESESREFLRWCTILVGHEKGYYKSGNRLGEMVSHWDGNILP